ncbi:phosphohistidine phosphatase SixA [bacterium]|nr:phosphohistidine phosphatase SixA [bacterium]
MHVILVRHGYAESGYTNRERPLTQEGRKAIEVLAAYLKEQAHDIDQILHSGILRARETAEILNRYIQSDTVHRALHLMPDSDPEIMKTQLESETRNTMLVSHLPFLNYLANLMVTGNPESEKIHFMPGCAVRLNKTHEAWNLAWALTPDQILSMS